jgi:hypothetical protein
MDHVAKSGPRTQSAELKPQPDTPAGTARSAVDGKPAEPGKPQTRGRKGTIVTTGKMNKAGKVSHITPSKPGTVALS